MAIAEDKLQELREKVDIVEVVGRQVTLKRSGKSFKGVCPFHQEKTPSFYVDPHRRSYKCFGCGEWGDALDFVQKTQGKSFLEAVRSLAESAGVSLPSAPGGESAKRRLAQRDEAYRAMKVAAAFYRSVLLEHPAGEEGRLYQAERAIDEEIAARFGLGYAPAPEEAGWDLLTRHLADNDVSTELAESLGLTASSDRSRGHYDQFRGRLMFPVVAPGGSVIAFSGRVVPKFAQRADGEKAPKYVNSPESILYKKSKTLFGLDVASGAIRREGRAILVEGNVDVLTMHARGYSETIAPLGTALTTPQVELLRRFASTVYLCFDGDRAGAAAAYSALKILLAREMEVRVVTLPDGEDPDSIYAEQLQSRIDLARPGLEWLIRKMVGSGARDTPEAKGRALRALVPLLRTFKKADVRGDYCELAANLLDAPLHRIRAAVDGSPENQRSNHGPPVPHSAPMPALPRLPRGQVMLASLLVDHPELATRANQLQATERILDPRLSGIAGAVLEAALDGTPQPGTGELLELVDEPARKQVFDHVFSGEFRELDDLEAILIQAIHVCDKEALDREVAHLDRESQQARASGDQSRLHELAQKRLELRRRQHELTQAQRSVGQP